MFPVEISGTGHCNAEIKFQGKINLELITKYFRVVSNTSLNGRIQSS